MMIDFIKMNGAGNDFVVIDARQQVVELSESQILDISARSNSVTKGCDQLIVIEPSLKADAFMRIYNADASEVDACGNATRCVAYLLERESGKLPVTLQTNAGILKGVKKHSHGEIEYTMVDLGMPKFEWQDIPLCMTTQEAAQQLFKLSGLKDPIFVNMGNPHVVFFMDEIPDNDFVINMGRKIEHFTQVFPARVNVSFSKIMSPHLIHTKIWERGAGLTKTCGTGACANMAAAHWLYSDRFECSVFFVHSEKTLHVSVSNDGAMLLGGSVEIEFSGRINSF